MYLVNVGTFTDFIQKCFGFCFFIRKFYHFQLYFVFNLRWFHSAAGQNIRTDQKPLAPGFSERGFSIHPF